MLRFGYERDRVIDELLMLSKKYPNFIANKPKQLNLLRKCWVGNGRVPVACPSWAVLALDNMGRVS